MATFLLIPGGASDPSYWRVLCSELADRSHRAIPIDLPCEDADVIAGGHMAMLSHAGEFADHLDGLV